MLLDNGAAMKLDVIESFNKAVEAEENVACMPGSTDFWNYVSADMHMDLSAVYASSYIDECFYALAKVWEDKELDEALFRLEVLKTDYLGMES